MLQTVTALGLAYCGGASPSMVKALVQSIAHVIKQEAKALGRHLVVRAPFVVAPMISNMQRIFDSNQHAWTPSIAGRVTPQTVRTAQNVVRSAIQGAARIWNGATPFAQRIASNPAATSARFQPPAVIQESVMAQHASSMQSTANAVASSVDAKIAGEFINVAQSSLEQLDIWVKGLDGKTSLLPKEGGNAIKEFSVEIVKRYWEHVFSDDHKADFLKISKGMSYIMNRMIDIIIRADAKLLLKEGPNHIESLINSQQVIVKAFLKDGKIISINGYVGTTGRIIPDIIKL